MKTKDRKRRQYDVIAQKSGRTLLVECKQWSGSRYRLSALKTAVVQHRERAVFYDRVMHAGIIFTGLSVPSVHTIPVIVMLIEEEIRVFEGIPLVPVHRLNAFIRELDTWPEGCPFAETEEEDPLRPEDQHERARAD